MFGVSCILALCDLDRNCKICLLIPVAEPGGVLKGKYTPYLKSMAKIVIALKNALSMFVFLM